MTETIFDLAEFKPLRAQWNERQERLAHLEAYYDGSVYDWSSSFFGLLDPRLASMVRPLYLPVARAVNVDAGIVPGHWKLADDAKRFEDALKQVFAWSRWDTEGVLFVHYGALYGCSGLRISDLQKEKRVIISPTDPRTFMLIGASIYDPTPRLALVIQRKGAYADPEGAQHLAPLLPKDASEYEYAEVISPFTIRTFANGVPFGFGGRPPEYANVQGRVPFVEVPHINTGKTLGDSAFVKVIPMLDQVNELATDLADVVHRFKDPQHIVSGADSSDLKRDGDNVWFLPEGASAQILIAKLDIPGTLAFLQDTRKQVEKGMPELAFDELTSKDFVATPTVELQLLELVLLIKRVRPNYDAGLVCALRMAGSAAAEMGLADVGALDDDDLRFDDGRPVLPLDANSQMDLEMKRLTVEAVRSGALKPQAQVFQRGQVV